MFKSKKIVSRLDLKCMIASKALEVRSPTQCGLVDRDGLETHF